VTFVDTGAWVALFVDADAQHTAALSWIGSNRERLVTSDYVVDEVITLIKVRFRRQAAIQAGQALFGERLSSLFYLTEDDIGRACGIFQSHSDKGWSFTDCTSLALMQRLNISTAFAFEGHFSQMRGIRRVPK
jgi:predicted nucleic acid-binding protein